MYLTSNRQFESLSEVSNEILRILETNTESDEVISHTQSNSLLLLDRSMSHEVGQLCQALISSQRFSQSDQLQHNLTE